jgi:phosphoribosylaminoimidazolecarboxamide formyltransferase/IMP cyclohydrolase
MRALVSVHDKTGLIDLGRGLADLGWNIISSGGTAKALEEASVPVTPVEKVTGSPEMLGGRVKTLHPNIHGGILADRSKPKHMHDLVARGIEPIDLVACNLYPFRHDPSIENIDIGGVTLIRAAAKNHASVGVVTDPNLYEIVLHELRQNGHLSERSRLNLAIQAFQLTSWYDDDIRKWLKRKVDKA